MRLLKMRVNIYEINLLSLLSRFFYAQQVYFPLLPRFAKRIKIKLLIHFTLRTQKMWKIIFFIYCGSFLYLRSRLPCASCTFRMRPLPTTTNAYWNDYNCPPLSHINVNYYYVRCVCVSCGMDKRGLKNCC